MDIFFSFYFFAGKRARFLVDGSEEDYVMEELPAIQGECSFEDICSDAIFYREDNAGSENESRTWGLLDGHVLARVFNFLRSDVKSLVFSALTCKHWRAVFDFYKDISRQVDLSSVGRSCTDSIIWKIMVGFHFLVILYLKKILCWLYCVFNIFMFCGGGLAETGPWALIED